MIARLAALRARLNRADFEYTLLGCVLLVLGAFSQLGWIGSSLP